MKYLIYAIKSASNEFQAFIRTSATKYPFDIGSENRDKIFFHKHVGYTIDNCIRIRKAYKYTQIIFTAESSAATGAAAAADFAAAVAAIQFKYVHSALVLLI